MHSDLGTWPYTQFYQHLLLDQSRYYGRPISLLWANKASLFVMVDTLPPIILTSSS